MRKFAANYVVSYTGEFLKNGIVIIEDDGTDIRIINTNGDLMESEQLIFYNGILITGYTYSETNNQISVSDDNQPFKSFVLDSVAKSIPFSLEDLINLGKQVQDRFPEMKIPAILNGISEVLLIDGEFTKENQPGIYLITGIDLVELRFTLKSRIKKIL